jgi:hypothetical protein
MSGDVTGEKKVLENHLGSYVRQKNSSKTQKFSESNCKVY